MERSADGSGAVAPGAPVSLEARRATDTETCWIFGYGSLIWRPAFPHIEARPAHIHGFARHFWQRSTDHRGTPEAPGRVVTLVPDAASLCAGMAFRVAPDALPEVLAALDHRESGGYLRRRATVCLHGAGRCSRRELRAEGWIYVADARNPGYAGPSTLAEIAAVARRAHGPSGPNREYVTRLAEAIRALGASDADLFALAELVTGDADR
jgi:glutathione-specific gamma-glutamylcyclotransferase